MFGTEMYTTAEGFELPRPLLLPDARSFADVLEYLGEWLPAYSHRNGVREQEPPGARIIGNERGHLRRGNEIGPYCTVDLSQLGGRAHRGMAVRATDAVIEALAPRIVTPDDSLSFRVIGHKGTGRTLVLAQHGYIIGDHWLACIDPATVPAKP